MIAVRFDQLAFVVEPKANPLAQLPSLIGGMRQPGAFASPVCAIGACRIRNSTASVVRDRALWIECKSCALARPTAEIGPHARDLPNPRERRPHRW
jgi:hypothetical protein